MLGSASTGHVHRRVGIYARALIPAPSNRCSGELDHLEIGCCAAIETDQERDMETAIKTTTTAKLPAISLPAARLTVASGATFVVLRDISSSHLLGYSHRV